MTLANAPLLLLSPYRDDLWSDVLAPMRGVDCLIGDIGAEDSLGAMAARVLSSAPLVFSIAGFCMGGYLAFEIIRRAPERVRALALINSSAAADSFTAARIRRERIAKLEARLGAQTYPDDPYLDHAVRWLVSARNTSRKEVVARVREQLAAVPIATSLAHQRAMLGRPDSRPLLPTLSMPLLLIGGSEDRMCAPSHIFEMGSAAPDARAVLLENCGHFAPLEEPILLTTHLAEWLGAHVA